MTTSKLNRNFYLTSGTFLRSFPEATQQPTQASASSNESNLLEKAQYRQFFTIGDINSESYSYAISASQSIYMNLNKVK